MLNNLIHDFCFFFCHSDINTVIDSNAVIESGLTSGNIQFLGSFDQCLSTQMSPPQAHGNKCFGNVEYGLHYCMLTFSMSMLLSPNEVYMRCGLCYDVIYAVYYHDNLI